MITGASFGFWSLSLGLMTYVLTRWWVASERILEARQRAYSDFLKGCLGIEHRVLMSSTEELVTVFDKLRETGADFSLYASARADELAGAYLGKVAEVISSDDLAADRIVQLLSEASALQSELTKTLRDDTLRWTASGMLDRARTGIRSMFGVG
jgi:hypothetical protein